MQRSTVDLKIVWFIYYLDGETYS